MSLLEKLLILSVFAQVVLTIGILLLMGRERVPKVMSGEIKIRNIAVERDAYPLRARLLSNNFDNQFQLPVLFYVAALLALWAGGVGWVDVLLSLAFVFTRYVHAAFHVTNNNVLQRFSAYTCGLLLLAALWVWLMLRIFLFNPAL